MHNGSYRPEIDGLRAMAILPVVIYHAFTDVLPGGFVGVDIFFVISGYLITRIIAREMADNSFSIWEFYDRRARRILPALLFVLAATLPFAWHLLPNTELFSYFESLVGTAIFASNVVFLNPRAQFLGAPTDGCHFTIDEDMRAATYDLIRDVADAPGAKVLLMRDLTCADGVCLTSIGAVPLYRDNSHMSASGSAKFGDLVDFSNKVRMLFESPKVQDVSKRGD